jgi:hypothetical protein
MGGREPREVLKSRDYVLVYESEAEVAALTPDEAILNEINLDPGGIAATARKWTISTTKSVLNLLVPKHYIDVFRRKINN